MEKEAAGIRFQTRDEEPRMENLMHHVNEQMLMEEHRKQSRRKATGIDGVTKDEYNVNVEENLRDLVERMKRFSYRPMPVRRTYIPKANGKQRPLGIPAYEDKLVQGVMAKLLDEVYEVRFLDCSYGFQKGKNCHDVVRYINRTVMTKKVNYVLEADIKGFFDNVNHEWLMRFLNFDIADRRFLRYVRRFLIAGVMEDGAYLESDRGTPQGGLISPVLANVYLHYVLSKEPWAYPEPYCSIMKRWLRFRHALLPWLYTKNVEGSSRGLPILYPVYYEWPDDYAAYDAQRDEYLFGGELMVAPITSPADGTGLAHVKAWLPGGGNWFDFTTGHRYPGGQCLRVYRSLSEVPIFVRPGTVIPMDGANIPENGGLLPKTLLFRAFAGASGGCHVVEDNGKAQGNPDRRSAETRLAMDIRESMTVMISPPLGDRTIIPENRRYVVELVGVENRLPDESMCTLESNYDEQTRTLRLELGADALTGATLRWRETPACPPLDKKKMLQEALLPLRMKNDDKDRIMGIASSVADGTCRMAAWRCLDLPDSVMGLLEEMEVVR